VGNVLYINQQVMSSKFFNNPQQPKIDKGTKKPIPTKPVKNNTQIKKTGRGN
jgi:hypothetical protein